MIKLLKESDPYKRIVYWSDKDNCFIGMCPELICGGVHSKDALKVFKEPNQAVQEAIEIYREDRTPLPAPKEVVFEAA